MKLITKTSPGTAHERYIIWRGWDFDDNRLYGMRHRRTFWTGCGWSRVRSAARVYRSDAEVRQAITRMENDGLAVNAEAIWRKSR